ncbi:MAG: PIG-L deacetylase family protein [Candidatus Caldatribacteriaceae bacterium]
MKYGKGFDRRFRPRYFYKAFTLCIVVTVILLYFFWEKSGSEVKLSTFQKAYPERPYHFSFSPSDTILLIAPHCDDEVLGAGGLLSDAQSQGVKVYVAVITNGDAFRVFFSRTKKAVELGYRRQKESLAALQTLGIPRENVFFLGYPDQGLALLWTEHWSSSNPYFSRFTRNWMDSYFTSYRPGSPYSGESLTVELESIISRTRPTIIITASPFDRHPDHWATYNFTMYALEKLYTREPSPPYQPQVFWYLVHYGVWPYASGFRPGSLLLPPPALCLPHLDWQLYFPSPFATFAKIRAIRKYQSQSPLGEHLLSFVRKNELFGQNSVIQVQSLSSPIHVDGVMTEWPSATPRYPEPQGEKLWRKDPSFSQFMVARDSSYLYLALCLEKPASSKNTYAFRLYPVTPFGENQDFTQSLHFSLQQKGSSTVVSHPEVKAAINRNTMEVAIPLVLLHHPSKLFFQVEIQRNKKITGKTAWYLFHLVE